ncbi:MAG TPA: hypothetical protein DIT01_07200, partial [Lentisphaeria bacterium]|nr:hypothetical protein [Lentisphaeria bacterium]
GDQDKAKYQYIKLRVEQLAKPKADVQKEYGVHEAKAEAVEQVADIDNASGISGSEVSKEDARKHDPSASETPKDAVCTVAAEDLGTLRKKAEAGDAEAQVKLGLMYVKGDGVPQDDAEAV